MDDKLFLQYSKILETLTPNDYRKWRLTRYLIADQNEHGMKNVVPVYDKDQRVILYVDPGFFSFMSLQGSGKLLSGELLNVCGEFVNVNHPSYAYVLEYHKKYMSKRPVTYSGIKVIKDKVVQALAFSQVTPDHLGNGYGVQNGIPLEPFKTIAADIGRMKKSDPAYKDKGGVVPVGTKVFIKELENISLPNKLKHDGWVIVNDTGGGIFGAHFDLFVGTKQLYKKIKLPYQIQIWFEGIEKIPADYSYGLVER
jgi:3D (Asp-Asp-Asp) domain-containing protein